MEIPALEPNKDRDNEYKRNIDYINDMVFSYVFEGRSYREIDEKILKKNRSDSRGYQSMNSLHHLGIRGNFKGIFKEKTLEEAIELIKFKGENYEPLLDILLELKEGRLKLQVEEDLISEELEDGSLSSDIQFEKEGKSQYHYSKKYERNIKNRVAAIKIHGTVCFVCEFDFEKVYGERGKGYIEIHHTKPLYTVDEECPVNPKTDLVPVCSNCHRMIHRKKDDVLSIESARNILSK